MAPQELNDSELLFLKVAFEALLKTGGRVPVFQYLDQEAYRRGIGRPDRCLEGISADLIKYEQPLRASSSVRLLLDGVVMVDPTARVLHHGFLTVLRALPARWDREPLLSSAAAQPVVAHAHELWTPGLGSATELRIVGLLLEAEEIGRVEWSGDPHSPWGIEIDFSLRPYAGAVTLDDYRRIRHRG